MESSPGATLKQICLVSVPQIAVEEKVWKTEKDVNRKRLGSKIVKLTALQLINN